MRVLNTHDWHPIQTQERSFITVRISEALAICGTAVEAAVARTIHAVEYISRQRTPDASNAVKDVTCDGQNWKPDAPYQSVTRLLFPVAALLSTEDPQPEEHPPGRKK